MFSKIRNKKTLRDDIIIYIFIALSVICFWIPFMTKGFPEGAEIEFHYTRITTLVESMKVGIFPAKLRPMHMMQYGYGVGFFYPDFFIYPMAFLILLGVDAEIAIKLVEIIIIIAGAIVTYRCFYSISGNKKVALLGEIIFMGSRINYDNFVVGAGIPHLCAYLFIPLAVLGLLEALKGEKAGFIKYGIGITMVVLSHHLIFMTMMLVMVIIVLIHMGVILRRPERFLKLFGVSIAALFLTTAYWLPALEQALNVKLIALYNNSYDITEHIMSFAELFTTHIGAPLYLAFSLAVIVFLVMMLKGYKFGISIYSILAVSMIILFITCSRALWLSPVGTFLGFFQYTERFIFILTALMIMFIVMLLGEVVELEAVKNFAAKLKAKEVIIFAFMAFMIFITRYDNKADFYNPGAYSKSEYSNEIWENDWQVSGAEWLPMECTASACKTPNISTDNTGSTAEGFKHDSCKYYEVWVDLSREYYDVPYIYYYGYKAYMVDENMNPTEELEVGEAYDDNGYVRVFLPEGGEGVGHMMVTYRKTDIQKISYVITLISAAAIAAFAIFGRKRKSAR